MPISTPQALYTALSVLRTFTCQLTPFNPSFAQHSALSATFTLSLTGNITDASISLSSSGINTAEGLLNIPPEAGYRAFDVFYYLLTSASTPAEREFLGLRAPSAYALLNRSGTYDPPSYLPAADDAASAEDFRNSLKAVGIKGSSHRNLLSILTGLLKLGDTLGFLIDGDELDDVCEEVGGLLGVDPEALARRCSTDDRQVLIGALYECLIDWVLLRANEAIRAEVETAKSGELDGSGFNTPGSADENGDTVSITILEISGSELGRGAAMRTVFDDTLGINAEMKEDGVEVPTAGSSVLKEMQNAVNDVAADLGITGGPVSRERDHDLDKRKGILERVGAEAEPDSFLHTILYPDGEEDINYGKHGRFDLPMVLGSSRVWFHLSLHPTDDSPAKLASGASTTSAWSAGTVSRQLRAWRLPEWANLRNKNMDFTADFDIEEFATRYAPLGCKEGRDGVESWTLERGWSNGEAVVGHERVWIREGTWWEAECMLDQLADINPFNTPGIMETGYSNSAPFNGSGFFPPMAENTSHGSQDNLMHQSPYGDVKSAMGGARSVAPTMAKSMNTKLGDYGLGAKGDTHKDYDQEYDGRLDPEIGDPKRVQAESITFSRRVWVALVWLLTLWAPSPLLRFIGRMKRPDIRMAWREKIVLIFIIFILNAIIVFYIIWFGKLLCPMFDKAWNEVEVSQHQGDSDFFVSFRGKVYDISKFWQIDHSKQVGFGTSRDNMQPFAGLNVDNLFPPPLNIACRAFVTDDQLTLISNTSVPNDDTTAIHTLGKLATFQPLKDVKWYNATFLPKINQYVKGDLVFDPKNVSDQGQQNQRPWFILDNKVYDLTDYYNTIDKRQGATMYKFLPDEVTDLIMGNMGQDLTSQWKKTDNFTRSRYCFDNVFLKGTTDFRLGPRCTVNNWILLSFTIIIGSVILVKFLAALQFGSKRRPQPQDKFVICQVPAYTEGEDQLRKGLDSLTALQYDNKRKLIFVICDGMIVGGGNDRPTPKIVLDILGVDPKIDPPALPFRSVGQGNEQLNYGKVYSGLYEFEGNVVPYVVIVKVGKESEQTKSKPGNRGKRDSQILLMSFLNRVHHRSPMNPLELEIFHQINNIIGVDPELYEYLFMVDADTSVREDSLNRLVAACSNDAKIAGICGETSLENEERSWWTMIQVYEYYISHHLAKAFESLFGSVTCLPGCFCMYRLRTADKGRPLIISDKVIHDYSDGAVDTLHKKNLLSLGEDRYLTTLMTKHFPQMSYKFVPDAFAATAAPETWSVLLSQRRRWINSTIHNLAELVFLKDLCGFCCFSMRFVVFIDLFGTIILPATCVYIGFLIYLVATKSGQFPLISIILLAAVYGLQALIFILKRQWQHIGWMIIYIMAFPIYSFILPIYSFWKQDDFSWGNTRIVLEEKGDKQIVAIQDEGFDPRSIPLQRWNDYALQNSLPGRRGVDSGMEKNYPDYGDNGYEMDDMRSVYSSAKPASTMLTGFNHQNMAYIPPQSPAAFGNMNRQSTMTSLSRYQDQPQYQSRQSVAGMEPYRDNVSNYRGSATMSPSQDNLLNLQSPPLRQSRSPLSMSRPVSTVDFQRLTNGPDDVAITEAIKSCLAEVDLDTVTKKQGKS